VTLRPGRILSLALLAAMLLLGGCGYRTAGHSTLLPENVRTLAVPVFVNKTETCRIETALTEAVVREFNSRTKLRVVSDPAEADAVLRGEVLTAQITPMTYDSATGRASSGLVTVTMKVTLTARDGRVLYQNGSFIYREQYQISRKISGFFEEEGTAVQRLCQQFARSLVGSVLEAF
jgi:outer membrane lipopolysaccharide assembly protein LptE/RlpB